MKKYGKYEKKPEAAPVKQPKATSVLLQTYFVSLVSMILCVTMFMGTSYAWFTSEVENTGNEIYIGTLDVDLKKQVKDDAGVSTFVSLADPKDGTVGEKLFDGNIRWEPGFTAVETIKVVNKGDLAFKYTLSLTDGNVTKTGAQSLLGIADVAKYFDVWVFRHYNKTYTAPNSYDEIKTTDGWTNVGTLDQLLAGEPVIQGNMVSVRLDDLDESAADTAPSVPGFVDAVATEDTFTIALHMNELAPSEVMGHKIQLNVKLVAYQKESESDSFGNDYDKARYVTNVEELQEALNSAVDGDVIRFANDIAGNVTVTQKPDIKFTIDGAGHTLKGFITVDGKSATYTTAGLTIKNVNFKADSISADACIRLGDGTNDTRYTCNVTVSGCTFDVPGAVGVKSYTGGDKNLTITGCTATQNAHSLVQAKGIDGVLVEKCNVSSKNGLNFNNSDNVTVNNCDVDVKGYAVRFGESSGGVGAAETYLIKNCTLKSACDDGDAVIVLRGTADYATLTIENTTITGTIEITNTATDATVKR